MKLAKYRKAVLNRIGNCIGRINQELGIKTRYFAQRNRFPNLKDPKDISEIVLSSMLKPDFIKFAEYTDKVKVRKYVITKGLEHILPKIYGIWDNPGKIDFSTLPNSFVLKANNGCGNHIICNDKTQLNIEKSILKLKKNIKAHKTNRLRLEPHYQHIKPLIFAEELIKTKDGKPPADIKFHCINGEPYDIFICTERGINTKYITYNLEWNKKNVTKTEYLSHVTLKKPDNLDDMIKVAEQLARGFDFVRVDFYLNTANVVFSELTFTPWSGYMNSYSDEEILKMGVKLRRMEK
ncbi:MAG TPA: ATP-grasp fold amidoligase family protein [Bacteroidales bacterium]|nr:ATP-grasp fold amidoligase family protein [Bacteroidales bacterium]